VHEADVGRGRLGDQSGDSLDNAVEIEPCRQDLDYAMEQLSIGIGVSQA
jgi:hypothetical protein